MHKLRNNLILNFFIVFFAVPVFSIAQSPTSPEINVIRNSERVAELNRKFENYYEKLVSINEKDTALTLSERFFRGDTSVVPEFISILNSGSDEDKKNLILDLINSNTEIESRFSFRFANPKLETALLQQLENKELEPDIIQLAGYFKFADRISYFKKRLVSGTSSDMGRLFYWLGEDGTDLDALQFMTGAVENSNYKMIYKPWIIDGFISYSESKNPAIRKMVVDFMYSIFEKKVIPQSAYAELENSMGTDNPAYGVCFILLNSGDSRSKPVVEYCLKHSVMIDFALINLVKLDLALAQKKILRYISDKRTYYNALPAAIDLFKVTNNEAVIRAVFQNFEKVRNESYSVQSLVRYLSDTLTSKYLDNPYLFLNDKDLASEIQKTYRSSLITPEQILDDALEMGLVLRKDTGKVWRDSLLSAIYKTEVHDAATVLEHLKVIEFLDSEPGLVPLPYRDVIIGLAQLTGNQFDSLKVMAIANEKNEEIESYSITLIMPDYAVLMNLDESGDWLQLDKVIALMNTLCESENTMNRFYFTVSDGQFVQIAYGSMPALRTFFEKYQLPFEEK